MGEMVERKETPPANILEWAISKKVTPEVLERLWKLKVEVEANEAKKAYFRDFAIAQSEIQPVAKKARNSQTNSNYAKLEGVIEVAQPIYTKHGFAVTFTEGISPLPEHVRNIAYVQHTLGHKEEYHLDMPLDGVGIKGNANMTKIHGKASALAYNRRYLMCMIWNIATKDDDGNLASGGFISSEQLSLLRDMLVEMGDEAREHEFAIKFGVESLDLLPEKHYKKAVEVLKMRKEKKAVKK